jgi:phosphate:Na+ symporter
MNELPVGTIVMEVLGGLAIFLYGMEKMTASLKLVAGERMKGLLARMTTNRFKGVFTGAFITAVIQSSSVTTVLVVGFISAGLMSLSQSIGIIMGASIGTTVTAQIVAFKVTKYSLLLVAGGFAMSFIARRQHIQHYGRMIMGLGLIFFGMVLMKDATTPLRSYEPFIDLMKEMDNPFLAVLTAAAFTGIVQSSSATTGVIIVLASQGFLSLEAGIPLVFGANIGTCVTAVLASIGKPREAVRAAMVHIVFNTAGVLIWLGFIPYLAEFIRDVSPVAEGLEGMARLKVETPRQIANAHTTFNVANTLLFIGFTPLIARLVEWLVPDRKLPRPEDARRRTMDDILVHTPMLALDVVRMEIARLGSAAARIVREALTPVLSGSEADLDTLQAMDDEVDELHGALITYLGRLSLENLSEPQSHRLSEYIAATNYLENIGDMVETQLVDAGRRRLVDGVVISPSTQGVLQQFYERVQWSVERSVQAISEEDRDGAQQVLDAKAEVQRLSDEADRHLTRRLGADEPQRLAAYRLESEVVESLKRIYYFSKRIAKLVIEETTPYEHRSEAEELLEEPALAD